MADVAFVSVNEKGETVITDKAIRHLENCQVRRLWVRQNAKHRNETSITLQDQQECSKKEDKRTMA